MSPSLDLFSWSTGPTRGASEGGAFVPSVLASDTAAIGAGRAGRTQTEDGTASVRWEKCAPVPRAERPVRQLSGSVLRKTEDSGDHRGCQKLTPCKTRPPCYTAGRCGSAGRLPPTRVPPLHPPPAPLAAPQSGQQQLLWVDSALVSKHLKPIPQVLSPKVCVSISQR